MVQQKTYQGRRGHILSQKDIDRMERIEENGKVKYFIPALTKLDAEDLDLQKIDELYDQGMSNKEIAAHFKNSLTWLNTRLIKLFGTSAKDKVRPEIKRRLQPPAFKKEENQNQDC